MKMRPHIMLQGGVADDAIALWGRAFPGLTSTAPTPPAFLWQVSIFGQDFTLFDSPMPHEFGPTPSWSFMVDVDKAAAVDTAHDILADAGETIMPVDAYDFAQRFCWVQDRFGISWQLRFGAQQ